RQNRAAAQATVVGWGAVAVLAIVLALTLPPGDRVAAVAAANSAGMLVLGGVLLGFVARRCGTGALAGVGRAGAAARLAGRRAHRPPRRPGAAQGARDGAAGRDPRARAARRARRGVEPAAPADAAGRGRQADRPRGRAAGRDLAQRGAGQRAARRRAPDAG